MDEGATLTVRRKLACSGIFEAFDDGLEMSVVAFMAYEICHILSFQIHCIPQSKSVVPGN